jgi:aldehyde:ferredoxin oxidoreductase
MAEEDIGGYMGKILRVDLSNEKISKESPDNETLRKYIGGTGLGVKYLYEEVPPGVAWNDAENRMMFMAGPFSGTRISGSGIFSVISKGPMTNMAGTTQANGYFGAFLKFSGFDGIVVQGKAKRWLYLHIHDGTAELRDAGHLQGKDTWDTEDAIKKDINKQCSVFTIGPAGENLVRFASIVGDHGHVAGHNGLGAVMGSKKLKAIVAERGDMKISVARPDELKSLADALIEGAQKAMPTLSSLGTAGALPMMHKTGQLPVKNYTTSIFPDYEKFSGEYLRTHFKVTTTTCWACRISHCRMTEVTEGPYKGFVGEEPEYEGVAAMSSDIGQTDPGATVVLGNDIDRLGMDINESGWLVGWLMECSQKGLLNKDDLDGIDLKWGDAESTRAILRKTAHREGNGNLWAEGVKRTAEKYGGEALDCAVYTLKGATPRGHDHRARWSEMIDTCLSNTGTIEVGPGMPAVKELGMEPPKNPFDAIEISSFNAMVSGRRLFEDSLLICFFCGQDLKIMTDALSAITGWDFDIQEAMDVGKRILNQLRVFNFRHGLTKDIEAPSVRYGSTPVDGPAEGKAIMPQWEALRRNYYGKMGWDPETGKPLPETLEKLGLAHLIPDLAKIDEGGGE